MSVIKKSIFTKTENTLLDKFAQLILTTTLKVVQLIPNTILMMVTRLVLVLVGYRRQVINKNFNNTSVQQYYTKGFDHFYRSNLRFFSRIIVEIVKYKPIQKSEIKYKYIDQLESKCNESNGLILLASHYGNWELACSHLPIHTDLPCYGVYKPLKNQKIDQYMKMQRSKHGLNLIPMKKIGRTILENRRNNKPAIYILISDQNPNSKNSIIWADFLGVNTAFVNGPKKLIEKYKFNEAYMEVEVGEQLFDYTVNINTESNTKNTQTSITQSYASALESQIANAPEYWLWSHKRWKRSF